MRAKLCFLSLMMSYLSLGAQQFQPGRSIELSHIDGQVKNTVLILEELNGDIYPDALCILSKRDSIRITEKIVVN